METPVLQLLMSAYYMCFSFRGLDASCVLAAVWVYTVALLMFVLNYLLHVDVFAIMRV